VITALILWAVIGPSVGLAVGAAFAALHLQSGPQAEDFGRSPDSALPPAPAGRFDAAGAG